MTKSTDPKVLLLQAAQRLEAIEAAREGFEAFCRWVYPHRKLAKHHLELIDVLDRLEKRTLTNEAGDVVYRLMVNLPPRHAKSECCTVLFPAYVICRRPLRRVMSACYGDDLAKKFGTDIRMVMEGACITPKCWGSLSAFI